MQVWGKRRLMGDGSLKGACISSAILGVHSLLFLCKSSPSPDPVVKKDVSCCIGVF